MNKQISSAIGRIAAIFIVIETIVFAFSLVWGILFHSDFDKDLGYIASLLLAISVVILMGCFYEHLRDEYKTIGLLSLAAALLYAPLCISNYFLQLSIVALNPLDLSGEVLNALRFVPGSPTFALDMLGYGFLCLSTLAAGFAFKDPRDSALKFLCFFHGALALPTIAAPIISGAFRSTGSQANDTGSYVLLFWCVIFVPLSSLFARFFRRNS
jgi:hypothetical protein